jgi:hypothetical protein
MYHNICGFGKQDGIDSSHLELYFYDDDPALEHRFTNVGWINNKKIEM